MNILGSNFDKMAQPVKSIGPIIIAMPSTLSLARTVLVAVSTQQVTGQYFGESVTCVKGTSEKYYRFMGGTLIRPYPSIDIARSYDSEFDPLYKGNFKSSCTNYTIGSNLPTNPAAGIPLYQAITCSTHDPRKSPGVAVYQLAGRSTIRWISSVEVGQSCTSNWASTRPSINCGPLYYADPLISNCSTSILRGPGADKSSVKWYP